MDISNAVVLVTGANRGLGLEFARQSLARGARKVYAAARDPDSVTLPGVDPLRLDVTRADQVAAAARQCGDVTILINNAGIALTGAFLDEGSVESARTQLETNFFGPLRLSQAFADILRGHGGGAILNMLSVASWINTPQLGAYGATKSAAWALTNGLRHEMREQGTQVLGLHVGFVDTDLTRNFDVAKTAPGIVVTRALDALEAGASEVLADEVTQQVKRGLSAEPGIYLTPLAR